MRLATVFMGVVALAMGCGANPNSLRVASALDGKWTLSVASPKCSIEESIEVHVSGRAFGVRIPNSGIFISGVIQKEAVKTEYSRQKSPLSKDSTETEIAEILVVFDPHGSARGTWRSSKCSGELVMLKQPKQ